MAVVEKAYDNGSTDDISAVVVALGWDKYQRSDCFRGRGCWF